MFERFKAWLVKQLATPETIAAPAHSTSATGPIDHENVQNVVPYDENLLERSRTQWQFGDWDSLVKLERDTLQHHPDRAKLALLAAAGHLQQGKSQEARQFTRLAQDWGCSKKLISQILISGVHNSLGRAAAMADQQSRALKHFETAIVVGNPGSPMNLIANARARQELAILGLLPGSQGRLQQRLALADIAKRSGDLPQTKAPTLRSTSEAHAFYINFGQEREPVPFLLIDSKSLPRSGLHYLKNTLSKIFGEHFSFCEWYQEPGCCKQTPCALTGFATHAEKTGKLRIRLTKSHDFELTDPVYEPNTYLRRPVLVRDPLYILTSWFALDQLDSHKDILIKSGININKIWLAHEKEVLNPAYSLLNDHFMPPSLQQLTEWLESKSSYIMGFMDKWVKPDNGNSESYIQVVRYEDINSYIASLASEFQPYLPTETLSAFNREIELAAQRFNKREDPFQVPSESVSHYIRSNSAIFQAVASNIESRGANGR
jgi:hypothetical protein